jgi:hypothetical protein
MGNAGGFLGTVVGGGVANVKDTVGAVTSGDPKRLVAKAFVPANLTGGPVDLDKPRTVLGGLDADNPTYSATGSKKTLLGQ